MTNRVLMMMLGALLVTAGSVSAQQTLTAQDRAEIQELSAKYAKALGSCAAEDYADVFVPGTGYFASNIRGEVVGRERLIALVQSERHCTSSAAQAAAGPRAVPMVVVESDAKGVTGRADLGAAGYYADEYIKTPKGWRIKARTVITGQEKAANITVQDTIAIRRLAGTDLGLFDDIYVAGPDGVKRFRTSGVALGLSPEGVTGRALLKNDGGYYEDVYVRTQQGGWRFKSRVYVAADAAVASTPRAQP
jgi:SnoaL-like protein